MARKLNPFSACLAIIIPLLLSGCVSMKTPVAAAHFKKESSASRQSQLNAIRRWSIAGALSIKQNGKAQIANFSWDLRSKKNYTVQISSSLNVYNIVIQSTTHGLTLNQNNHSTLHARNPQELMQKAVGFTLPLNNLYYWIRGITAPGGNQPQFDRFGHLTRLKQQGWNIHFMRYTHVNTLDLPQLVQLSRNNLSIRLVIRRWTLP